MGVAPTSTALRVRRLSNSSHTGTVCLAGIEPGTPRFTASYADHYTTDTVNQRKGWESNPQGLAARSRSRRGPSPGRVAHPSVVPGGIEPPISSVSGRRLCHSTTGLSVPRPGVEPGPPRSKRGVIVRFTTRAIQRKVRESNPHSPEGNRVSTAARPTVSGYLPSVETVGIEPTAVCLQDRLATLGTCAPNNSPGWDRTTALPRIRGAPFRSTTGLSSCGGRIRTGVGRLMRPRWNLFSSPLRSDQGGSRTHKHQALDLTAMPVRVPGQFQQW